MKVNILSRKLMKPSVPTPDNLRKYKISLTDEFCPALNISPVLYYSSNSGEKEQILKHLEEALTLVLPQFYPLAGRYVKEDSLVDCLDLGVEFVLAQVDNKHLLEVIMGPNHDELDVLLPRAIYEVDGPMDPLLSIQVTRFACGGMAICASVSHRIMDGSSVGTFLAAWATVACSLMRAGSTTATTTADIVVSCEENMEIAPSFDSFLWFPRGKNPGNSSDLTKLSVERIGESNSNSARVISKRLVFRKEAISRANDSMATSSSSGSGIHVSKVCLVTALIAKALVSVDRGARMGRLSRTTLVAQTVNVRGRTIPPLSKHLCGNLLTHSIAECTIDQNKKGVFGIEDYVRVLGEANKKTIVECTNILSPGADLFEIMVRPGRRVVERQFGEDPVNVVWVTDWSKFGFYGVDFGWGKPVWASVGTMVWENCVTLMESKEGDGIEAWVTLRSEHVAYLEQVLQEEINPLIT